MGVADEFFASVSVVPTMQECGTGCEFNIAVVFA